MLGRIAYIRTEYSVWIGPLLNVDAVSQKDGAESIWGRQEVAEIDRDDAATLGFTHGSWGYVWWGPCPPSPESLHYQPSLYRPDPEHVAEYTGRRSFYPYPKQENPTSCP